MPERSAEWIESVSECIQTMQQRRRHAWQGQQMHGQSAIRRNREKYPIGEIWSTNLGHEQWKVRCFLGFACMRSQLIGYQYNNGLKTLWSKDTFDSKRKRHGDMAMGTSPAAAAALWYEWHMWWIEVQPDQQSAMWTTLTADMARSQDDDLHKAAHQLTIFSSN